MKKPNFKESPIKVKLTKSELNGIKYVILKDCKSLFSNGKPDGAIEHQITITFLGETFAAKDADTTYGYHCEQDENGLFDLDSAEILAFGSSASEIDKQFTGLFVKRLIRLNKLIKNYIKLGGKWDWRFKS